MTTTKKPTPAEAIAWLADQVSKFEDTILALRASEATGDVVWFKKAGMFAVKTATGFSATNNPLKATPAVEFAKPWMLLNGMGDSGRVVTTRWACEQAIQNLSKAIDYTRDAIAHWRAQADATRTGEAA